MGKNSGVIFLIIFNILFLSHHSIHAQAGAELKEVIVYTFENTAKKYQIGVMETGGSAKKSLTSVGNNWSPSVSPDGKLIAFYSDRTGFSNLWVMNSDGSGQRALTEDLSDNVPLDLFSRSQLAFSHDSKSIYYLKSRDLWRIDLEGTDALSFTETRDVIAFRPSPDGHKILYAREKNVRHIGIWTMLANGTAKRQLEPSDIIAAAFDWGHNDMLAYYKNIGIFSMSVNATNKKRLNNSVYSGNEVEWSKVNGQNRRIAYISSESGIPSVYVMDSEGKNQEQVSDKYSWSPAWSRDGNTIIFVEEGDVYSRNLATKEKRRLTFHFKSYAPVFAGFSHAKPKETMPVKESEEVINE